MLQIELQGIVSEKAVRPERTKPDIETSNDLITWFFNCVLLSSNTTFLLKKMSTRHARTADRASNEKYAKVLKTLLQKTPNKYCADCKKKGRFNLLALTTLSLTY